MNTVAFNNLLALLTFLVAWWFIVQPSLRYIYRQSLFAQRDALFDAVLRGELSNSPAYRTTRAIFNSQLRWAEHLYFFTTVAVRTAMKRMNAVDDLTARIGPEMQELPPAEARIIREALTNLHRTFSIYLMSTSLITLLTFLVILVPLMLLVPLANIRAWFTRLMPPHTPPMQHAHTPT